MSSSATAAVFVASEPEAEDRGPAAAEVLERRFISRMSRPPRVVIHAARRSGLGLDLTLSRGGTGVLDEVKTLSSPVLAPKLDSDALTLRSDR